MTDDCRADFIFWFSVFPIHVFTVFLVPQMLLLCFTGTHWGWNPLSSCPGVDFCNILHLFKEKLFKWGEIAILIYIHKDKIYNIVKKLCGSYKVAVVDFILRFMTSLTPENWLISKIRHYFPLTEEWSKVHLDSSWLPPTCECRYCTFMDILPCLPLLWFVS